MFFIVAFSLYLLFSLVLLGIRIFDSYIMYVLFRYFLDSLGNFNILSFSLRISTSAGIE